MKKIIVLCLLMFFITISCEKIQTPYTKWENIMDENVVIVCNGTDFTMLPMTKYRRDELNSTKPMWGYEYQVYQQRDYLREHPVQTGTATSRNIIEF